MKKNILITFGSLLTLITPLSVAVSCTRKSENSTNDYSSLPPLPNNYDPDDAINDIDTKNAVESSVSGAVYESDTMTSNEDVPGLKVWESLGDPELNGLNPILDSKTTNASGQENWKIFSSRTIGRSYSYFEDYFNIVKNLDHNVTYWQELSGKFNEINRTIDNNQGRNYFEKINQLNAQSFVLDTDDVNWEADPIAVANGYERQLGQVHPIRIDTFFFVPNTQGSELIYIDSYDRALEVMEEYHVSEMEIIPSPEYQSPGSFISLEAETQIDKLGAKIQNLSAFEIIILMDTNSKMPSDLTREDILFAITRSIYNYALRIRDQDLLDQLSDFVVDDIVINIIDDSTMEIQILNHGQIKTLLIDHWRAPGEDFAGIVPKPPVGQYFDTPQDYTTYFNGEWIMDLARSMNPRNNSDFLSAMGMLETALEEQNLENTISAIDDINDLQTIIQTDGLVVTDEEHKGLNLPIRLDLWYIDLNNKFIYIYNLKTATDLLQDGGVSEPIVVTDTNLLSPNKIGQFLILSAGVVQDAVANYIEILSTDLLKKLFDLTRAPSSYTEQEVLEILWKSIQLMEVYSPVNIAGMRGIEERYFETVLSQNQLERLGIDDLEITVDDNAHTINIVISNHGSTKRVTVDGFQV